MHLALSLAHRLLIPLAGLALFCAVLVSLPAAARAQDGVPAVSDELLEEALSLAGGNRGELEAALSWCIQKPYSMQAMRFLIANLPLADLGVITDELLIEHVELAIVVSAEMPYAAHYDEATWAHYVLAPRVSQEPLEPWRGYFYGELAEQVRGCETLQAATVRVKDWVWQRIKFKQTQRRDQGPLTTLRGVYGRCEELMTVEICALRAVGIPARNAFCPWWAHCDNNHAWTEVRMDNGRWYPAGSIKEETDFGSTWEQSAARGAPIVCSMCFGLPEGMGPEVLRSVSDAGARYAQINGIGSYREPATLRLDLLPAAVAVSDPDRSYKADDSIEHHVFVHVFNYGALRPIAKVPLSPEAEVTIQLGAGRYVLSTDLPVASRAIWVDLTSGETAELDWLDAPEWGEELILEFPKDP